MTIINRSIRNQIIFWAGLCLLASNAAGILSTILILQNQAQTARAAAIQAGEEKAAASAGDIAEVYAKELTDAFDTASSMASSLAAISYGSTQILGSLTTPSRDAVSQMVHSVLAANPQFMGMYTDWEPNAYDGMDTVNLGKANSDLDGRFTTWWARSSDGEITYQDADFSYADELAEDYYQVPLQTKQTMLVEPYIDEVNGKPYLMTSAIVPILAGQTFLGIAGIDIVISDLQAQVDEMSASLYDGSAQIEIITSGGVVVARSGDPTAAGKSLDETDPQDHESILAAIREEKSALKNDDGQLILFSSIRPGNITDRWSVMLTVPESKLTEKADAAYNQIVRLLYIVIAIAALFLGLTLLILWQSARAISRPIQQMAGFLSGVARGDVTQDVPQALRARADENGSLARSAQSMIDNLRKIFMEMNKNVEILGTSSSQLLSISAQTTRGASQSSHRAHAVAAAAEEMSVNTASVASGVEQVTMNLASVAAITEEMTTTINKIAGNSERARATTVEAAQQADKMSALMKEMGSAAQEIGKVTETITTISAQTNLLALNATIELARAGAAGRGFAVVANEIKELAQQTAEATGEIKQRIAGVQRATTGAVTEIDAIVEVIKQVNDIVTVIVEAIQAYSISTRDIAINISRASSGAADANQRVSQTAGVSRNIAEEISEVSSTARDMVSASEQVQGSAVELSRMAEHLQQMVAFYKV